MIQPFSYDEFTNRNIGFVTSIEQDRLRDASVFVCGTGGMGGAGMMALARAGVGKIILADIDAFEVSNLNRQVFAFIDTVGKHKAAASAELLRTINPEIKLEVLGAEWATELNRIAGDVQVVINGTDDLGASLHLYRTARTHDLPVIDAYASPLPSVYVTRAGEAMPEERLGYPTIGRASDTITDEDRLKSFECEAVHVLLHSSSRHYIDLDLAGEVAAGRRPRMSFAPMVITTGMLMAYETIALLLKRKSGTDNRGWFFNPYKPAVERPLPAPLAAIMRPLVKRVLGRMMAS